VARETNLARLRAFALVGARARLDEIKKEEAGLKAEFPELFRGAAKAPAETPKRGRRAMSAAQKKAVSERMRKYWADRRKKTDKKADKK
jgi:hypothetical protein